MGDLIAFPNLSQEVLMQNPDGVLIDCAEDFSQLGVAAGAEYLYVPQYVAETGPVLNESAAENAANVLQGPWSGNIGSVNICIDSEVSAESDVERNGSLESPFLILRLGGVSLKGADVVFADSLPTESRTIERYGRLIGEVAAYKETGKVKEPERTRKSSLDNLRAAGEGDASGRQALLTDAKTHVYEVFGGVGESMSAEMSVNANNEVIWGVSSTEDRQFQVLTAYTKLSEGVLGLLHAEGLSNIRLEELHAEGLLEGKAVFDFSAMAEASRDELNDWGFFLNSIACSVRRTTFEDQSCKVESIFLAGVDQRQVKPVVGETEDQEAIRQEKALAMRFDIRVLRKMYQYFGYEDADKMSPAEMLAKPIIASEDFGLGHFSMLYDIFASEETADSKKTFMGSVELWEKIGSPAILTLDHYESYMDQSQARQEEYDGLCDAIVNEQIRRRSEANTPLEAVKLKRQIVLDMTVEYAIKVDSAIDETRFGRAAAPIINKARWAYAQGNAADVVQLLRIAKDKAVDPSCPTFERDMLMGGNDKPEGLETAVECKEVKDGDKVNCPYCGEKVTAKVPEKNGRIYCSNDQCTEYVGNKK